MRLASSTFPICRRSPDTTSKARHRCSTTRPA
jgi:hypothetical protein